MAIKNGSITITRVDNESIRVQNNAIYLDFYVVHSDGTTFYPSEWFLDTLLPLDPSYPVINALLPYNYSILSIVSDAAIMESIREYDDNRRNEIRQAASDLANRTHVNTYSWEIV